MYNAAGAASVAAHYNPGSFANTPAPDWMLYVLVVLVVVAGIFIYHILNK